MADRVTYEEEYPRQRAPEKAMATGSPRSPQPDGSAHTPLPWSQSYRVNAEGWWNSQVYDAHGETIATLSWYPVTTADGIWTAREANAEFIVRACNSHDDLLKALKDLLDEAPSADAPYELYDRAHAAIAKAEAH